jgi:hypothetical protein
MHADRMILRIWFEVAFVSVQSFPTVSYRSLAKKGVVSIWMVPFYGEDNLMSVGYTREAERVLRFRFEKIL